MTAILLWDSTLAFIDECSKSAGAHILVDSLWPKMTALLLIADIHCNAIVEFVRYEEFNARINLVTNGSTGVGPLEAGKLNDQRWEFGTLLQNTSDAAVLSVLEAGFTPFNDGNAQAQQ